MLHITLEQLASLERPFWANFGVSVVAALREDWPQALEGLSETEESHRLETALNHAQKLGIRTARDLRSFIRLCFVVGPNFSTFPPFSDLLASGLDRMAEMFNSAQPDDWDRVAILDIVSRYPAPRSMDGIAIKSSLPLSESVVSVVPLTMEHAEAVYRHGLHPDVWRLAGAEPMVSLENVHRQILEDATSRNRKRFAAIMANTGFVGELALDRQSDGAELSYWIRHDLWGRGVATKAIKALLVMIREQSAQLSVVATTSRHNGPSIRALEKSGFIEEFPKEMGNERYFVLRSRKNSVD